MQTNWGRAVMCAITVPTGMAVLFGCGVVPGSHGAIRMEGTAGPAGVTAGPTAAGPTPAKGGSSTPVKGGPSTPGTSTSSSATVGCAAGGAAVPKDAGTAETADLDGDRLPDTLWLAVRGNDRVLGVETASGARFSTVFSNAAPASANAVAGRLGDGTAVILLDFSREAKLYAVTGCKIVPSLNTQGKQYTFDEGFRGYGTGAGCPVIGSQGRRLVGYLAQPGGQGDGYNVTRTIITLSQNGARATNGATETVGEGVPESSSVVSRAQAIICGPGERAFEPAG